MGEGILEVIKTRRSIRKYKNIKVDLEKINLILEAGRWAPSSGNLQNWYFIVVQDKKKINKIAEYCMQPWISTAPLVIVVCSDTERVVDWYGERGRFYSIQNIAAAVQNMLLQAHSIGLGSCWIGAFNEEKIKELLKIPKNIEVHAIITLGYPDESPESERKPLEDIVFFEEWGSKP